MWAPVCAVLGPQGAGLPGARFVTGGDKGTDFSIMNRPGAALGKPFFTCRSSKKQQGEVVFSFPSNAGGGGGGPHTGQPSLPSEANAARAHSPPRGQPPHGIPAPGTFPSEHVPAFLTRCRGAGSWPEGPEKWKRRARGPHAPWALCPVARGSRGCSRGRGLAGRRCGSPLPGHTAAPGSSCCGGGSGFGREPGTSDDCDSPIPNR